MKVVLRQINRATVLGDEGMRMAELAAWVVKMEARAAGQPDRGNALVIQRCGEFIKARYGLPSRGNQFINRNVEDAGSLAQAWLRVPSPILTEFGSGRVLAIKKGGRNKKRRADCAARLLLARQSLPGP